MTDLSHVDAEGRARMVDVSAKADSVRRARAIGTIRMSPVALKAVRENTVAKGDVLTVAKIAGIMGAKRTPELVPLCHSLALTDVQLTLTCDESIPGVRAESRVATVGKTGVEMEAIVAVSIALVTVYDMVKALDREMEISGITLVEKSGGRSGDWSRG